MPFKILNTPKGWKIKKLDDNSMVPTVYKTKQSAINTASNWMRYESHGKAKLKVKDNVVATDRYFK